MKLRLPTILSTKNTLTRLPKNEVPFEDAFDAELTIALPDNIPTDLSMRERILEKEFANLAHYRDERKRLQSEVDHRLKIIGDLDLIIRTSEVKVSDLTVAPSES